MQDILKEYGPAMITIVAVIALVGVITVLIGDGTTGIVSQGFAGLIQKMMNGGLGGV